MRKTRIAVLGTGGTIAGEASSASDVLSYQDSQLSAADTLAPLAPYLPKEVELLALQISQLGSENFSTDTWLLLAHAISRLDETEEPDGFVLTQGTDTLEETAYFLHLALKTAKPVVVVGAMYYYLFLVLVIVSVVICHRLENSRIGRAWMAIREDEIAAKAMILVWASAGAVERAAPAIQNAARLLARREGRVRGRIFIALLLQKSRPCQGRAVAENLERQGRNLSQCRVGKFIALEFPTSDKNDAMKQAKEMAEFVLHNPLIESFTLEVLG